MPFCKYCGTETDQEICPDCLNQQHVPEQEAAPAAESFPAELPPDAAFQQPARKRPLYIIPVFLLFSLLILFTLLYFMNTPEKRAEKLLNSYAKSYLVCDTDAALRIMPQCEIEDLKREWGEDGYKELLHTSLTYSKAEYLTANYGEEISIRFQDVKCKEMKQSKIDALERHLESTHHARVQIKEAYYISCTIHVAGSKMTADLPVDNHIVLFKADGRWSLYGATPALLAPDNEL